MGAVFIYWIPWSSQGMTGIYEKSRSLWQAAAFSIASGEQGVATPCSRLITQLHTPTSRWQP